MLVKDIPAFAHTYSPNTDVTDIIMVVGQSNAVGQGTIDGGIDVSGGSVVQLAHEGAVTANFGTIVDGAEPLYHVAYLSGKCGFAVGFARDFYVPNVSPSGDVLIVPCGVGNTGMDRWSPGDDLFNAACAATGVALAMCPNASLKLIMKMQGEYEAALGTSEAAYAALVDAEIAGYRAEFGSTVPVIVGGMRPDWVAADAGRQGVQDALADTPNRLSNVGYADPSGFSSTGGTDAHYTATELRGASGSGGMAEAFWDAWAAL